MDSFLVCRGKPGGIISVSCSTRPKPLPRLPVPFIQAAILFSAAASETTSALNLAGIQPFCPLDNFFQNRLLAVTWIGHLSVVAVKQQLSFTIRKIVSQAPI